MRTAIGRIAGPLRPPTTFEIFGRRVSTSMTIARNVLTSDTASAPASSAARANDATSVTFGVSFGITGSARHLAHGADDVERAVEAAAELDAAFLDVRAGDVQLDARRRLPRPTGCATPRRTRRCVVPQTLTITVAPRARSSGSFSSMNRCAPMPCRPIAFSMPDGVSTIRGAGCPSRSLRNSPFDTIAPSVDRSTTSAYSTP